MKKAIIVILTALFLTSCTETAPPDSVSDSDIEKAPVSVGVSLCNLDDNYISIVKQALEDTTDSSLTITVTDAEGNPSTQTSQIEQLIGDGAEVLLVSLNNVDSAGAVANLAAAAEINVVFIHRQPAPEVLSQHENAFYIGINEAQAGTLQAEMALADFAADDTADQNGDGVMQYVLIKGESANPLTDLRSQSVINTLDDGGAESLAQLTAEWNTEEATRQMLDLLAGAALPEVIVCNSDSMALGALAALNAQGVSALVYGIDAIPQAVDAIKAGTMAGTVYNNPYTLTEQALTTTAALARGEEVANSAGVITVGYETVSRYR